MVEQEDNRSSLYLLLSVFGLFLLGRLFGSTLFDNGWSFQHWQLLPIWWPIIWGASALLIGYIFAARPGIPADLFAGRRAIIIGAGLLVLILIACRTDSFVWGGGNLRVAQIAQVPMIILRWYEAGSIQVVSWLYTGFESLGVESDTAGVLGWRVFSFACTILSLIASLRLVAYLTEERRTRFYLFLILFFGPQTLLYFGYIGLEPVIVTVTLWFAVIAAHVSTHRGTRSLLALWALVAIGVLIHVSLAYLIPAAIYATLRRWRVPSIASVAASCTVIIVMLFALYYLAADSFGLARQVLFLGGKTPFTQYGLFSLKHLGDFLQLLFLVVPLFVMVKITIIGRWRAFLANDLSVTAALMAMAGNTVVLLIDPVNSIVLDLPRITAYLTPMAVVTAVVLADRSVFGNRLGQLVVRLAAVMALLVPLSFLPSYLRISEAQNWAEAYFETQPWFYHEGSVAFRDASFEKGDLDRANYWDQSMVVRSTDVINMRGIQDLISSERYSEAINILYQIKTTNPYWIGPRDALTRLQMSLGRYRLARPEIDTMLMIDPYRREGLAAQYQYFRDTRDYARAIKAIHRALDIFPSDKVFRTDEMLVYHRAGAYRTADSLATVLTEKDPKLAYPYLVKGMYADGRGDPTAALTYYDRFLSLAPDVPEATRITARVAELRTPSPDTQ